MKKRPLIIGVACTALAVAVALTGFTFLKSPAGGAKGVPSKLAGALQGFEPGAEVTYSIFSEKGEPAKGNALVQADGRLVLPEYDIHQAKGPTLTYNVQVYETNEAPVTMTLVLDAATGKINLESRGLPEFASVVAGEVATKADWAGIVKMPGAGTISQLKRDESFRVALSSDIMSDVAPRNPKIIDVIIAGPWGGDINPGADLNRYEENVCDDAEDPSVEYSFCDEGPMQTQIDNIVANYVPPFLMATEELTAVMMQQVFIVGTLFDAKTQLEMQRHIQELTAEAHKDYQPGEMMCQIGTFVRSITTAEDKSKMEKQALNEVLNSYYRNLQFASSAEGPVLDIETRARAFRTIYCDPSDNNNGLVYMCDHDQDTANAGAKGAPAAGRSRINKDINYHSTMDSALTLDFDMAYAHTNARTRAATDDEADVIALAKNLYWAYPLSPHDEETISKGNEEYVDMRKLMAVTNVAHNSYITIAGLKAKTDPTRAATAGWTYMKALMRDSGLSDADITRMLGEYPSYYAQMEVLTKKMYQQPDFYTNLYDKPTNVKRISASLQAIEIMQQRDFFESALRREMLTSMLVEEALTKKAEAINGRLGSENRELQRP